MAVKSASTQAPSDSWDENDEIDLRRYVTILFKRWREILVITLAFIVLVGLAVYLLRTSQTPMYEASANVAILRTQSEAKFDDRFTTSSSQVAANDVSSRRTALLGLVFSGAIAEQVSVELSGQLDEAETKPARLLRQISAELNTPNNRAGQSSDLIVISARADSPEKAAVLANTWAQTYVQEVNRIYGQVPDEMLASVQTELDKAKGQYEQAQRTLEDFLATSQINTLRRQVQQSQEAISALQKANTNALSSYINEVSQSYQRIVSAYLDAQTQTQLLGFSREQAMRRDLIKTLFRAYSDATLDPISTQVDRDSRLLRMYYDQWLRTTAALSTARTLQAGLVDGGAGAVESTATALQLLKVQLVNSLTSNIPTMQQRPGVNLDDLGSITLDAPLSGSTATTDQPVQNVQTLQLPSQTADASPSPLFQIALSSPTNVSLDSLNADLSGIIAGLERQLSELEQTIAKLNDELLSGERLQSLQVKVPEESTLVNAIREQYPELFEKGIFSTIAASAAQTSTLAAEAQAQATELLKLAGVETALLSGDPSSPISETIAQLEQQLGVLQSELEAQSATNQQVVQQRDLAWDTFNALSTKQTELTLERAVANSEVRMGTTAIAPDEPVRGISLSLSLMLAAVVGLLVAVFVAFLLEFLGKPPLFTRSASQL